MAVNCGAIPEELIESELFGHKRGAFTGAVADKLGLFQQADGGTLFLDEIGELSTALQVKLLRALQERKVKPVGDTDRGRGRRPRHRRDQPRARGGGGARRVPERPLLPPQRHRGAHRRRSGSGARTSRSCSSTSSAAIAAEQDKRVTGLTPEAMRALEAYDYPGNVRELENIIEHAVTLCAGPRIEPGDLPRLKQSVATGAADAASLAIPDEGFDLDRTLSDYERAIVGRALEQSGGVRKRAARLLGISFRSLRYRLAKLGMEAGGSDAGGGNAGAGNTGGGTGAGASRDE